MPIAIQEDMLTGDRLIEKFETARALGVDGIEFWGAGLTENVPEIVAAMQATGLRAAPVNQGGSLGRLLDPLPAERERALANLRQSIMNACDIGAPGVIVVPHFGAPILPDLAPWMTAAEMEIELMYTHLRTLEDYAEAMGVDLYIEPINRYETHLLNRLEQAAALTRRMNHPRVKIVADLFHMALEEADLPAAIRAHADCIGHVHLADNNRRLPGEGSTDFAAAAAALGEIGYGGWASFECGRPTRNNPADYRSGLPASIAHVRDAGFV
ncbi:MAG: sugar phosphate isomerase/epimerase family protein [Anaerolineae bacterium]